MLTKMDITALRKADDICIHLNSKIPDGLVRAIKRKGYGNPDPFATDIEHAITAKVEIDTIRGRQAHDRGDAQCFAMIGLYHAQHTNASCIARTLREGDEITFRFYPDGHTNGYCAMTDLHADMLYLDVRREGKVIARWEIDVEICKPNSARMIRGVPNAESYARDAEEARRVA